MRKLFLLLAAVKYSDEKTAKELQDIADSLWNYLTSLNPSPASDEQLQDLADDYCIYFYLTALKYHTVFIINKDEIKTNILVNCLVALGIDFKDIDMNTLIATAIKAENIAANYFKGLHNK